MEAIDAAIQEVQRGDRERFGEVFVSCEAVVRVVLAALLPDRSAVDDLVHEVFVTAYLKIHEYRPGTDFRAWLRTIARNTALNERRKYLRQRALGQRHLADLEQALTPSLDRLSADVDRETLEALRLCLDDLTERSRRLIESFYFQSQSGAEIANREGKKESWVRLTLFRARAALLVCLQQKGALAHD